MKQVFMLLTAACIFASCNNKPSTQSSSNGDSAFQKISDEYIKGYLDMRPQLGVALGFHEYDKNISDYSKASLDKEVTRLKYYDSLLASFDTASLSKKMFIDFRILQSSVKNELFNFNDLKTYTNNPMTYAGAVDMNSYVKRNFAPLEDRLQSIIAVEKQLPSVFIAAKANLSDSLAKPYIDIAINIAQGSVGFLKKDLLVALKDVKNDTLMKAFKASNDTAIAAINDYVSFLQKEKLPKAHNHYAIGEDNYKKMLLYGEDITLSPEKILEIGLAELKKEQAVFNASAHIINPNKKPIDVYHDVESEHPTADSLIPVAKKHLESIRQYLIDKNICSMPSEVRVQVKETPEYARATSTASLDIAGPFEKNATESYYYITPVDNTWTAQQKEDWLAMFNYYTTDVVTIHEAYPGHYTQGLHLNASNATKLEKIFGSYAFIEGWAHYTEKMMLDEGYGNNGDSITAAKYRMAQSGDALLRICRLCVSIKTHCQGISVDEATKFFMDNWYQGDKPSRQEALRGTFDPGYLFYTLGKLQILKLRDDYQKQEGANYSLKKFNDMMMDNGMPPIRLMREIMLKDSTTWNDIL
jgi:uncharacterized protein (DUF885 family)